MLEHGIADLSVGNTRNCLYKLLIIKLFIMLLRIYYNRYYWNNIQLYELLMELFCCDCALYKFNWNALKLWEWGSEVRQSEVVVGGPGGQGRRAEEASVGILFHQRYYAVLSLGEGRMVRSAHFLLNPLSCLWVEIHLDEWCLRLRFVVQWRGVCGWKWNEQMFVFESEIAKELFF